jgi:hypothetical protein
VRSLARADVVIGNARWSWKVRWIGSSRRRCAHGGRQCCANPGLDRCRSGLCQEFSREAAWRPASVDGHVGDGQWPGQMLDGPATRFGETGQRRSDGAFDELRLSALAVRGDDQPPGDAVRCLGTAGNPAAMPGPGSIGGCLLRGFPGSARPILPPVYGRPCWLLRGGVAAGGGDAAISDKADVSPTWGRASAGLALVRVFPPVTPGSVPES